MAGLLQFPAMGLGGLLGDLFAGTPYAEPSGRPPRMTMEDIPDPAKRVVPPGYEGWAPYQKFLYEKYFRGTVPQIPGQPYADPLGHRGQRGPSGYYMFYGI